MNQSSTVPEYIVEEQAETSGTVKVPNCSGRDFSALVVDMEVLAAQLFKLEKHCLEIADDFKALVLWLREQQ